VQAGWIIFLVVVLTFVVLRRPLRRRGRERALALFGEELGARWERFSSAVFYPLTGVLLTVALLKIFSVI
jgi:hypothetical protein